MGTNLKDSCKTALNNFCAESKDGTDLCVRGLIDSDEEPRVRINNADTIICRGILNQDIADNVIPAIREHFNNFENVIVGKLPNTFSGILLSDLFTIDGPRKVFQKHQAKYNLTKDQVAFILRFLVASDLGSQ